MPARFALFTTLGLLSAVTPLASQDVQSKRSMTAGQLTSEDRIDLDGRVTEDAWFRGTPAREFTQREPTEGATPSESTVVYVVFDADNLYIGVLNYDSNPDGILAFQKERDAFLFSDDRFMWVLDTFLDGRTGYYFEINPAGLMGDGLIGGGGGGGFGGGGGGGGGFGGFGTNRSWDGIWEARVARFDGGWSAEVEIPFRTLNFNPNNDTWGINFQRTVRRKNEEMLWTGYRRTQQFTRPVHAGLLTGLTGMSQGLGLEVQPYAVGSWKNDPSLTDPTEYPTDAGLDVSYNVTPSLRASVTLNTDFAEVEVDQRRVNLTRFPLRFPERRDFFLEGSGVFSFSPRNGVEPYFSRNIGLADGAPVPIVYGARLGGQLGRFELGFIQVRTGSSSRVDEDTGLPYDLTGEDFTVARVKRTIGSQSSIGAIYTRRATSPDSLGVAPVDRHTIGMDLDFFTSTFLGDKNFQFEAFVVHNTDPDPNGAASFGDLTARGIRVSYPNDLWRIHTSYRELPEAFEPALGFTRRNGFRRFQPTVTFAPRPTGIPSIRQFEFEVMFEYLTDMDWRLETRNTQIKPLAIRFESGDRFDFEITQLFERLVPGDTFMIGDVTIPPGDYNTLDWRLSLFTAGRRIVSGRAQLQGGEFWSGTRMGYEGGIDIRPVPGITFGADYERNDISLPDVDFSTNLIRVNGAWHISPWASFNGNVQYDDISEVIGLYGRLRWIIKPGSDFFLVLTHNWDNTPGASILDFDYHVRSRGLASKLTYTHRF